MQLSNSNAPTSRTRLLITVSIVAGSYFAATVPTELPLGLNAGVAISCCAVYATCVLYRLTQRVSIGPTASSVMRLDLAFLAFFYILYIHPYALDAAGLIDSSFNRFLDDVFFENANAALTAATFAAVFFTLGVSAGEAYTPKHAYFSSIDGPRSLQSILQINLILGLAALCVFIATGGLSTLQGQYTGLASGDLVADGLNFIVGHFAAMTLATVFATSTPSLWLRSASILFPSAWALILLGAGDRNSFLLVAGTGLVSYSIFKRRLSLPALILLAVFAYSGYNAVEYARSSGERSISGVASAILEGKKDTSSFDESSFSLTTLTARASMEDIDGFQIPFAKFKLIGLAGVVPLSRGLFVTPGDPFISSSDVLSEIIIGPNRTWSIGSGIYSDIIIDLGAFMIPLVMFIVGWTAGRLQRAAFSRTATSATVLFCFALPLFFEYPRYTIDFPVRNLVWASATIWLIETWGRFRRGTTH